MLFGIWYQFCTCIFFIIFATLFLLVCLFSLFIFLLLFFNIVFFFSSTNAFYLTFLYKCTDKMYTKVTENMSVCDRGSMDHPIISSVQSLSRVWLFATPWTAARQASLSITNSWSSPRLTSIESVMPSSHLILCHPLLLPPWIFPSIRVFSNESVLCIRWPKYWSFRFSINPSNEYSELISFRIDW